jgi:predicted dehydrogenase
MSENGKKIDRRKFLDKSIKTVALASLPLYSLGGKDLLAATKAVPSSNNSGKTRIALVGTGTRGIHTWGRDLLKQFPEKLEMVALCDINTKRAKYGQKVIETNAPIFHSDDFEKMIKKTKPEIVIVTTPDSFHAKYAIKAMELGCDVISEKPLVTETYQAQELLDVEAKTGRKLIIAFNARHENGAEEMKRIVLSGKLGKIISVDFQELLDIHHGASYFRRWHKMSQYSGTLLLHKASHHFDKMNWILDTDPEKVHSFGKLSFYGKNSDYRGRNCRECNFTKKCKFYMDITKNKGLMDLYVNNEDVDGYLRDGCVFDNEIDIYDTMQINIKYKNGVVMSYTMDAFMPYEAQKMAINGDKARLDVRFNKRQPWDVPATYEFRLTDNFGKTKTWLVKDDPGVHGGADNEIRAMIFDKNFKDPLKKHAGSRAGVLSSLIGIAARESIKTGEVISIDDMVKFPKRWNWK